MIRHWRARRAVAIAHAVRRIKDKPAGVNAQRKATLLAHLRGSPEPVTRHDVVAMFEVNLRHASALLGELLDEGLICRVGVGRYHLPGGDN